MRKVVLGAWLSLMVVGVVVYFVPDAYIPARWRPYACVSGPFEGKPVQFVIPDLRRSAVPVELGIKMDSGACVVSPVDPNGRVFWKWTMEGGTWCGELPARTVLWLDPGQSSGRYTISAGRLPWHPLGSQGRLFIFVMSVSGLVFYGISVGRKDAFRNGLLRRVGIGRFVFVSVLMALSGLFYSAVHEFGHITFGMVLGGKPNWGGTVWTPFSGEEPHAAFEAISEGAGPWMSAGGILLPTGLGIILLGVWMLWAKRLPWYVAAILIVPGLSFLIGNVGIAMELAVTGHSSHMEGLAHWYHFPTFWTVVWDLVPFLLTLAMYVAVGRRLWGLWRRRETAG